MKVLHTHSTGLRALRKRNKSAVPADGENERGKGGMSRDSPVTHGGTSLSWLQDKRMSPLLEDAELRLGRGLQAPAGSQARFCSIIPKRENFVKTPRWETCCLRWQLGPPGREARLHAHLGQRPRQPRLPRSSASCPQPSGCPFCRRRVQAAAQRSERAPSP